ncbi:hypothetical protein ACFY30_22090 [Streptomyces sp. NPDC000345]|uniref:hypothetical protein n=1 Tax=Streptomyces sp. NPDC000345 TaxID=3364537 RepID=UPI0036BC4409
MSELPTAAEPPTTPEVARVLAEIETAKLGSSDDVADCLTAIGDLIRNTGTPKVLDWVKDFLIREELRVYALRHDITVHESRAVDEDLLNRTVIIWSADGKGLAIVPSGQSAKTTLLQLREEIAQREEDLKLAADFQASVAAGHVEDVEFWHARVTQAGQ